MSARSMIRLAPRLVVPRISVSTNTATRTLFTARFPSRPNPLKAALGSRAFSKENVKPLDDAAKHKILETWRVIERDLDTHAVTFYKTMLEQGPAIRQLFVNRNEYGFLPEDSEQGLKRHSIDVMVMIGHAVAGLNDLESIAKELKELAERHAKYGVELEHFPIMGNALLLTLEKELGDKWTPEVKDAWVRAYDTCRELMEDHMDAEHQRLKNFKDTDYMRPEHPH
mmetsp:Transcript_40508/g.82789  ORF Transcript_40508/g.82789 Transcript_40508/m.82789 type:complete len:226 (+) Transcript_40508:13-690(+)|eukprot:CAMPEP_0181326448 /NCGR_PEP_ID=MMETSP1101-20121128/21502_1 /TAXON_ID=46948 /ORGANISM="Rhodomonas abbreviata, Strain Caron Lab Isolate" /LENGTH=225 /DNA_ID=CAMNT_0023434899 /DNA_START=13 /DNA_END=690 /DNA_ORIENTATION=-